MTLVEALAAHDAIPADKRNNNCVQDAQWRLRDMIKLAERVERNTEEAPSYVVKAVRDLRSWL